MDLPWGPDGLAQGEQDDEGHGGRQRRRQREAEGRQRGEVTAVVDHVEVRQVRRQRRAHLCSPPWCGVVGRDRCGVG